MTNELKDLNESEEIEEVEEVRVDQRFDVSVTPLPYELFIDYHNDGKILESFAPAKALFEGVAVFSTLFGNKLFYALENNIENVGGAPWDSTMETKALFEPERNILNVYKFKVTETNVDVEAGDPSLVESMALYLREKSIVLDFQLRLQVNVEPTDPRYIAHQNLVGSVKTNLQDLGCYVQDVAAWEEEGKAILSATGVVAYDAPGELLMGVYSVGHELFDL